jgi:hypothetical protein
MYVFFSPLWSAILTLCFIAIAATIQLGMVRNLRFLLFTLNISQGFEEVYFNPDLISVIRHFEDPAVTIALKELTIAVNAKRYLNYKEAIQSLANCQGWEKLDSVLLDRSPVLQKVHICLELQDVYCLDADTEFQIRIQMRLPRLAERGVLVAEHRKIHELRATAWSRSGSK